MVPQLINCCIISQWHFAWVFDHEARKGHFISMETIWLTSDMHVTNRSTVNVVAFMTVAGLLWRNKYTVIMETVIIIYSDIFFIMILQLVVYYCLYLNQWYLRICRLKRIWLTPIPTVFTLPQGPRTLFLCTLPQSRRKWYQCGSGSD